MNEFKVKCISGSVGTFTVGKTYSVKDGMVSSDIDSSFGVGDFNCLDDINEYGPFRGCGIKFEKVEESKMFTKADLRNNDWCVFKDGTIARIVDFNGRLAVIGNNYYNDLNRSYRDDLIESVSDFWSISKVYRPEIEGDLKYSNYSGGNLIFDREKGIGCKPPVKEITVSEAEKSLTEKFGENVKIVVGK